MVAKMLVGGEWVASDGGATAPVSSPFDGAVLDEVPVGTREDARRAIDAARRAFDQGPWPRLPPRA